MGYRCRVYQNLAFNNNFKTHYFRCFCIALLMINDMKCSEMCQSAYAVIAVKRIRRFGDKPPLFIDEGVGALYKVLSWEALPFQVQPLALLYVPF